MRIASKACLDDLEAFVGVSRWVCSTDHDEETALTGVVVDERGSIGRAVGPVTTCLLRQTRKECVVHIPYEDLKAEDHVMSLDAPPLLILHDVPMLLLE